MADQNTNGPTASRHIFLYQLNESQLMSKVRFLCCVTNYDEATGCLEVQHRYKDQPKQFTKAIINIEIVLESISRDMLSTGNWINVIGYVKSHGSKMSKRSSLSKKSSFEPPVVQAVLLWDAGAIKVPEYERAIELFQESMKV